LDSLGNMLSGGAIGLKNASLGTKQFATALLGITAITPLVILGLGAITTFIAVPFNASWVAGIGLMRTARLTMLSFAAANPFVLLAGAIAATTYVMYNMSEALDQTADRYELLSGAAMRAEEAQKAEELKLNDLIAAATTHNATQEEKERAMDRIHQLHSKLLGDLKLEELGTDKGTAAILRYNEAMEDKILLAEIDRDIAAIPSAEKTQKREFGIGETVTSMLISAFQLNGVNGEQQMRDAEIARNIQQLTIFADERDAIKARLAKGGNLDWSMNGSPLGGATPTGEETAKEKAEREKAEKAAARAGKAAAKEAEQRVTLHRKMLEEISRLDAENIMDERIRAQELAELSFLSDIEAKKREYNDAKMPLDEAYFTWVAARAEKNRQEILEAEMKAFQQITLKKMEAIKASDIQSNKDAAVFDIGKSFSASPGDLPVDFIANAAAKANKFKSTWETMGDAFGDTNKEMRESLSMLTANTVGNMGIIVGEMVNGTAQIQDLGFVILDTLASILRQLAMVQLAAGIGELFTSKGAKGWNKIGAGFALAVGSGIARSEATRSREQARELYNQGRKDRIAPLKVNTKLLGQNLVVSSERTIKNNNNN
jgi:hypothetical protein